MSALTLSPTPPANISATRLDFPSLGMNEYADCYAVIIDNAFTPDECAALIALAESTPNATWAPAAIDTGNRRQVVIKTYRNSGRIMRDDPEIASQLLARIRPFLSEIEELSPESKWAVLGWGRGSERRRLTRLNERLRFLKYEEGQYFKQHMDGVYETPDNKECSFVTFQMYLSDDTKAEGGATRILGETRRDKDVVYDVEPKMGRVLVFQHNKIWHSGEKVTKGEKVALRTDFMYEMV